MPIFYEERLVFPSHRQRSTKTCRIWISGQPPFPCWWNASSTGSPDVWRWWDGEQWSAFAWPNSPLAHVKEAASLPTNETEEILWNDYWPAGARVPRVWPDGTIQN